MRILLVTMHLDCVHLTCIVRIQCNVAETLYLLSASEDLLFLYKIY